MNENISFRDPGEPPVIDWIDKGLIDVDPTYQRELDEGRVQKILDWFDWRSFGAVVVAPAEGGRYHVTDGQHRLEAAKRHPMVSILPAVIVSATGVAEEAEVFVGINANRRNVSALQLFWAQHAAGDADILRVVELATRAGMSVNRYPASKGEYQPGQTIAVSAIDGLIRRWGDKRTVAILEQLAKGKLAPVTSQHVKAAEVLLTDAEFEEIEPETLSVAIEACKLTLDADAKAFAQTHRVPTWRAMASTWFRKARKRRKAA